jgi:hypothetical protein
MKNKSKIANFACLRKFLFIIINNLGHKSHRKCIAYYLKSDSAINSRYLCPLKCSEVYVG